MAGFIISTNTVALSKRPEMISKILTISARVRYIVRPSIITRAEQQAGSISLPQSSMADMAI